MKTVVIWDTVGMDSIKYFVLDGDFSHLNEVYINAVANSVEFTD